MKFDESVLRSSDFQREYQNYLSKFNSKTLSTFLDNIDTNKKYYRMVIHKNKRYSKVVTEDTQKIKQIISMINKLTDVTYQSLSKKIISSINEEYLIPYIIETLVEHSLTHHMYIHLYVGLLKQMSSPQSTTIINRSCDKYFQKVFLEKSEQPHESSYLTLCKKNKNIDNIIGFSLFITKMEQEGIIKNQTEKVLQLFMKTILELNEHEEIYKMLISFHNISQIKFPHTIPEEYTKPLNQLKTNGVPSKIKFKIMDILSE
jgi:hypothetical protein